MNARLTSAAEHELWEAADYYESREEGLGAEFVLKVEEAVKRIVLHPLAWTAMSPRTRRCRTKRFPYGVFYQIRPDEIMILSIMDMRRDPKGWEQHL